jgi:hypothetical protein
VRKLPAGKDVTVKVCALQGNDGRGGGLEPKEMGVICLWTG